MAAKTSWPVLDDETIRRFVLQTFGHARWTQDSPVAPDIWISLIRRAEDGARSRYEKRRLPPDRDLVDVLITPWSGAAPGEVASYLREGSAERSNAGAKMVALNAGYVVACVNLGSVVQLIIPMTEWWQKLDDEFWLSETNYASYDELANSSDKLSQVLRKSRNQAIQYFRFAAIAGFIHAFGNSDVSEALELIGVVKKFAALSSRVGETGGGAMRLASTMTEPTGAELVRLIQPFEDNYGQVLEGRSRQPCDYAPQRERSKRRAITDLRKALSEPHVAAVNENRPAAPMLHDSRRTVKADAAQHLFKIETAGITFAVIDGGIDATHPGLLDWAVPNLQEKMAKAASQDKRSKAKSFSLSEYGPREKLIRLSCSRVIKTYDFTRLRKIQVAISGQVEPRTVSVDIRNIIGNPSFKTNIEHLKIRGEHAREIDWSIIEPLIEIKNDSEYTVPFTGHGTHVAGIIAADLRTPEDIKMPLVGMCPSMRLYDFRTFDEAGNSDEFTILSAVEFAGWLNRNRDFPVIHGVNLSLALRHDVDNYACGRTPICEACNWLVGAGTVVIAAAGNRGFDSEARLQSMGSGYRSISITDPGNADNVITVGATHRRDPHAYGVSYFSGRGPTGDGRRKPDLVAPGEKITSIVPGGKTERMDGTSMAAPHVSGAAALLMARYPELIGQPVKIKEILMRTATDLGRERNFQGAGLVDALRALQSV